MFMRIIFFIISLSLFLNSNANTQEKSVFPLKKKDYLDGHRQQLKSIFDSMDLNKDGKVTFDEFAAGPMREQEAVFNRSDINMDGIVTEEEEKQTVERMRKAAQTQQGGATKTSTNPKPKQETQKPSGPQQPKN